VVDDRPDYFETGTRPEHLALHSDAMLALATDGETELRIIDIQANSVRWILKGHVSRVVSALFSPDGRKALSLSKDEAIWLWNLDNGEPIAAIELLDKEVATILFRSDGEQFVVLCKNGTGHIYSATDCSAVTTFMSTCVKEYFMEGRARSLYNFTFRAVRISFTPRTLLLFMANYVGKNRVILRILDLIQETSSQMNISSTFDECGVSGSHTDEVRCLNRDCSRIVLQGHELFAGMGGVSGIALFNVQTGQRILSSDGLFSHTFSGAVNFSADGTLFVRIDRLSGQICVYDAIDGLELYKLGIESKFDIDDIGIADDGSCVVFTFQEFRDKNVFLRYEVVALPAIKATQARSRSA